MKRAKAKITVFASVLGVLAAASWAMAQASADEPAASPRADVAAPGLPPLDSLSETVERPLFLPNRRIPEIDEPVEDARGAEFGLFSLLGTIVSPTERIALVVVKGSSEVLQMSEGQEVSGWRVREIHPNKVIFESNDRTEAIEFIDNEPTRRPDRAPARTRRPQAEKRD